MTPRVGDLGAVADGKRRHPMVSIFFFFFFYAVKSGLSHSAGANSDAL